MQILSLISKKQTLINFYMLFSFNLTQAVRFAWNIIQNPFFFYFIINKYMFYLIPIFTIPLQNIEFLDQNQPNRQCVDQLDIQSRFEDQYLNESKQISDDYWELYLKIFYEELTILYAKQKKKVWSSDQDQILLNLDQNQIDWKKISCMFEGTNPQICKRRYYRIVEKFLRWPKEIDDQIKFLRDVKLRKWSFIAKTIQQKFGSFRYTGKMIKERYEFYLRGGIQLKEWTIQEDIKLLQQVKNKGRYWKIIMPQFSGRTQLQLKNRYNGTLKLIEKRVLIKVRQIWKDKKENIENYT